MLCEICNERPATVHITKIINGVKSEFHICEQCARERNEFNIGSDVTDFVAPFSFSNILTGLMDFTGNNPVTYQTEKHIKCPACGLDFEEFKRTGMLGCSECYHAFADRLEPIIKRIHGNTQHTGKVPRRTGGLIRIKRDTERLKYELKKAIDSEEFEKAAKLRDRIKELENKDNNKGV
ncbi:MAG: UvrB/UvrC motif-containing protein [Clostridiales bacterium]|nr:UvrB/UvrC motif-containing protein [Clostridiales bacterium]HBM80298.1 hypothetical protein [Clostridiaceae bacterium]